MVNNNQPTNNDVESLFGLWNSSMGGFSDMGAHQYFVKSNFFMPELLLKELCGNFTFLSHG